MKRLFALLLALVLLAGCAPLAQLAQRLHPDAEQTPAATLPPAPSAAPQTLHAADLGGGTAGAAALADYAAAAGVTLEWTEPAAADLLLLPAAPEGGTCLDLAADPLLAAAIARAGLEPAADGAVRALPLGRTLYAWWADGALLEALLGEGCLTDVQHAAWPEMTALAEALTAWLAEPAAVPVTLNGKPYTLPAQKPAAATALTGVFALAGADPAWTGSAAALTAPLLAAGDTRSEDTLRGPLNGLSSALLLEQRNAAGPAQQDFAAAAAQLQSGQALFLRAPLADLAAACGDETFREGLVAVPFKGDYVQSDLSTATYNLNGLLNYPAFVQTAWLGIPAGTDEAGQRAAAAALLWLYGSAAGESALIDDLLLVTAWGTASDTCAPGAEQVRQVGAGILPGAALTAAQGEAIAAAWQRLLADGDRAAWRAAVLAALLPGDQP